MEQECGGVRVVVVAAAVELPWDPPLLICGGDGCFVPNIFQRIE